MKMFQKHHVDIELEFTTEASDVLDFTVGEGFSCGSGNWLRKPSARALREGTHDPSKFEGGTSGGNGANEDGVRGEG